MVDAIAAAVDPLWPLAWVKQLRLEVGAGRAPHAPIPLDFTWH
jgi:hypothetical protein